MNKAIFTENSDIECNASYENPHTKLVKNDYEVNNIVSGIVKNRLQTLS